MSDSVDYQSEFLQACREITRDKINLLTKALASVGRIKYKTVGAPWGYRPLATELAELYKVSKTITPDGFKPTAWRKAIDDANRAWWDWYESHPLDIPDAELNYTLCLTEQQALREQLRLKYGTSEKVWG